MGGSEAIAARTESAGLALGLIETLAAEIGPRRPTSVAERTAAQLLSETLSRRGVAGTVEPFPAYASFGHPYATIASLALVPSLLPRRARLARGLIGGLAAGLLAAEGGLRTSPVGSLWARSTSVNVTAAIEPRERADRTLCLMAHLDSSRSGLMFSARFEPHLHRWIAAQSLATIGLALEPVLPGRPSIRVAAAVARSVVAAGLGLLVERELRGEDVPGANDNASGAAVVAELAAELAAAPLRRTRIAILITGSEEAGVLGARAFLDSHDTARWLFLNVDGVGAPATLRYLPREGVLRHWDADPGLLRAVETLRRRRPELALEPIDAPTGLTYDSTAVLARGGRALTLVAADGGRIPNYHRPTDTPQNIDPGRVDTALEVVRQLAGLVDEGIADPV